MQVLGICGSSREHPHSMTLLQLALEAARDAGATTKRIDLLDVELPLFQADGRYPRAYPQIDAIRAEVAMADGFLLASPEYHGSMSGRMKNFFDFHNEEFTGKVFGLIASTGGSYGCGCAAQMRVAVEHCHGWTLPYHAGAQGRDFGPAGELHNDGLRRRLAALGRDVVVYGGVLRQQFEAERARGAAVGFAAWHALA